MIKVESLCKKFNNTIALNNVTFHVEKGDIYGFIGHNGAGKTTTLKILSGIIKKDSGNVFISGSNLDKEEMLCKKKIAFLKDNPDLYEYLTGVQFLNFICNIYKIGKTERLELISKYSKLFNMEDKLGTLISSYSHGMKQKLLLISAFIRKPEILILDEPFVGLDPSSSHVLKELMREFSLNGGAILFSTHILEVAEKLCNKVAIIKKANILYTGLLSDLLKDKSLEETYLKIEDE